MTASNTAFYILYDRETGYIHQAGQCAADKVLEQARRPQDDVIPYPALIDPNEFRVDLSTGQVVRRGT